MLILGSTATVACDSRTFQSYHGKKICLDCFIYLEVSKLQDVKECYRNLNSDQEYKCRLLPSAKQHGIYRFLLCLCFLSMTDLVV